MNVSRNFVPAAWSHEIATGQANLQPQAWAVTYGGRERAGLPREPALRGSTFAPHRRSRIHCK